MEFGIQHGDNSPSAKGKTLKIYVHDTTSDPRMQSNSERMAGWVVAVNHNHLKHMIALSFEFGVHIREAYLKTFGKS